MSPISRAWHGDRDSSGAGTQGSPWGCTWLAATGSLWSLPPAQSCCLWGEQPQGSLVVDVCLQEPKADSCLLAGTLTVYRKTTSCFDLRDRGDKPILVTPKNPHVRMRHHPGIPWAQLGLWLCSIPPAQPATNQLCLRPPGGMLAAFIFSELIFSTASLLAVLAACRAARQAGGLWLPHPHQCCPSGSHSGFTSLSKSLVSSVPAPC